MQANYVKDLSNFNGKAKLFKVNPALKFCEDRETQYIAVSQVCSAWVNETYAFPANEEGEVVDWLELNGSMRGDHSHEDVIRACGYEIEDGE